MKPLHLYIVILSIGVICFGINYLFPDTMRILLIPDFSILGYPTDILTVGLIIVSLGIATIGNCIIFLFIYILRTD